MKTKLELKKQLSQVSYISNLVKKYGISVRFLLSKRKTLFWIMNGNVAYSIWIKQEKASFGALSYVKEDLCFDGISDKNRRCNSRGKKLYFPFFFFF